MPVWKTKENFYSFHQGKPSKGHGTEADQGLEANFYETVLDRIRHFAEACDHVDAIDIITDSLGGFSGLTASIIEDLREDYGSALPLPIWCLTDDQNAKTAHDKTIKEEVISMNSALFLSECVEDSNLIAPISLQRFQHMNSLAAAQSKHHSVEIAVALETAMSYRQAIIEGTFGREHLMDFQPSFVGTKEWCSVCTRGGLLPVVALEYFLPGVTHTEEEAGMDTFMLDSFVKNQIFHNEKDRKSFSDVEFSPISHFDANLAMNPFTKSLFGFADVVAPSLKSSLQKAREESKAPCNQAFVNVLCFRGMNTPGRPVYTRYTTYLTPSTLVLTHTHKQIHSFSPLYGTNSNHTQMNYNRPNGGSLC